jgi:hypothetical protein
VVSLEDESDPLTLELDLGCAPTTTIKPEDLGVVTNTPCEHRKSSKTLSKVFD